MVKLQQYITAEIALLPNDIGKIICNIDTDEIYFNSGVKYNEVLTLNNNNKLGINTNNPLSTVDINSANGDCLRFTYNNITGDSTTYGNISIGSTGIISFTTVGSSPSFIFSGGNINIESHNGTSSGLMLGGILITVTRTQLNTLNSIAGTATPNKVLVTDNNNKIIGLNSISSDILIINGYQITNTGGSTDIYTTISTLGIAEANKALIVNSNINITGINILSATTLTATNITELTARITELETIVANLNTRITALE